MKKVFFAIAMLAAGIFSVNAQDVAELSLGENVTVYAGDTVTVEVSLFTNFASDAFQIDVNLPEGLSFVTKNNKAVITGGAAVEEGFTLSRSMFNSGSSVRVLSYLTEDDAELIGVTEGTGEVLFSFKVFGQAAGEYDITLSTMVITNCVDNLAKYSVRPTAEVKKTITIEEPTYYLHTDISGVAPEDGATESVIEIVDNLSYTAVDHVLAGTHNFTVTVGNEEGATVYAAGSVNIPSNGKYDITYTFDATAKTVTATITRVGDATGCDNLDAATAEKLLIDGNVIIRRNGVDYTVTGQKL